MGKWYQNIEQDHVEEIHLIYAMPSLFAKNFRYFSLAIRGNNIWFC